MGIHYSKKPSGALPVPEALLPAPAPTVSDVPVGYGRPPRQSQFRPGQSGNPRGRPKGVKNLSTDVSEELAERILVSEGGKPSKVTKQRALLKTLLAKALKGDVRAAVQIISLTPMAEQARQAVQAAHSMSPADQEILEAFARKLLDATHPDDDNKA